MAHISIAHVVPAHEAGTRRRFRRRTARAAEPIRPSHQAEIWYRDQLLQVSAAARSAGADLLDALRPSWPLVHDAAPADLGRLLDIVARRFGGLPSTARRMIAGATARNVTAVDRRTVASLYRSVGIDFSRALGADPRLSAALETATRANVDLITSIPAEYLEKVRAAVTDGFTAGLRWEALAPAIAKVGDVTDYRAKVIARDQTGKMTSAISRIRQTGLGIEEYSWLTAEDERVRYSHYLLDRTRQRWDSPPIVDGEPAHPGEPILCRCTPIPVFNLARYEDLYGLEEAA